MSSLLKIAAFTSLISSHVACSPVYPRQSDILYFFNFGDSYTQNGFIQTTGPPPSIGDPTGHPALGSNTFSEGPNYVEWLTTAFNTTQVLDYDFGWGGATVDDRIVPPSSPTIATFGAQVTQYFEPTYKQGGDAVPWTRDNSIFSIFFGINDLTLSCADAGKQSAILDSYFNLATDLYNAGARKFLFIGVPPVDRSPVGCNNPQCEAATCSDIINSFNYQLATRVQPWAQPLAGAATSIYDFHAFMQEVLNNPGAFGFNDAICAGNGDGTCIWNSGNPIHTGYSFQKIVAQNMTDKLTPLGW